MRVLNKKIYIKEIKPKSIGSEQMRANLSPCLLNLALLASAKSATGRSWSLVRF